MHFDQAGVFSTDGEILWMSGLLPDTEAAGLTVEGLLGKNVFETILPPSCSELFVRASAGATEEASIPREVEGKPSAVRMTVDPADLEPGLRVVTIRCWSLPVEYLSLSPSECAMFRLLGRGSSPKEMAESMGMTGGATRSMLARIRQKFNAFDNFEVAKCYGDLSTKSDTLVIADMAGVMLYVDRVPETLCGEFSEREEMIGVSIPDTAPMQAQKDRILEALDRTGRGETVEFEFPSRQIGMIRAKWEPTILMGVPCIVGTFKVIPSEGSYEEMDLEILRMVASGDTIQTIARKLDYSEETIRNHARALKSRMRVSTFEALAVSASRAGLI